MGDDLYPARARPVPFCRHGFAPERFTSAFVLVLAEPERRAARMATTVSWTACVPCPSSINWIFASLAPALVKTFALISPSLSAMRTSQLPWGRHSCRRSFSTPDEPQRNFHWLPEQRR